MIIVADENIPYVREAFSALGEVRLVQGRKVTSEIVKDADVLLVRSVTKVHSALLEGSRVQFVGTATIGTDHIDLDYLERKGIAFASAPGSNATSVAEYVTAALLTIADKRGIELNGRSVGIVGVGNVGSRVKVRLEALGMKAICNDPPLARATGDPRFRPLAEVLKADVVTLHVPLTREGPDATFHLADAAFFNNLRPGAIFLNTSRGAVVDERALRATLSQKRLEAVVLDVWENEPNIDIELAEQVDIATPHIAGYSFDGKVRGTVMLYQAVREHFGLDIPEQPDIALPTPTVPEVHVDPAGRSAQDVATEVVRRVYDIEKDDARLRETFALPAAERGKAFDALRKNYPVRREFENTKVKLGAPGDEIERTLRGLGFRLS